MALTGSFLQKPEDLIIAGTYSARKLTGILARAFLSSSERCSGWIERIKVETKALQETFFSFEESVFPQKVFSLFYGIAGGIVTPWLLA